MMGNASAYPLVKKSHFFVKEYDFGKVYVVEINKQKHTRIC